MELLTYRRCLAKFTDVACVAWTNTNMLSRTDVIKLLRRVYNLFSMCVERCVQLIPELQPNQTSLMYATVNVSQFILTRVAIRWMELSNFRSHELLMKLLRSVNGSMLSTMQVLKILWMILCCTHGSIPLRPFHTLVRRQNPFQCALESTSDRSGSWVHTTSQRSTLVCNDEGAWCFVLHSDSFVQFSWWQ